MPSPFPGMNPYLERAGVWEMFHTQFISAMQQVLTAQLRPKYLVRMETRIYVHEPSAKERFAGEPDIGISHPRNSSSAASAVATLSAPHYGKIPSWIEIEKSRYLEIRDKFENRVVTILELLSPSNKYAGPDREQYIAKRSQVLLSRVHFIEMDLLRGGPRMPVEGLPPCDYHVLVSHMEERPNAGIWAWRLREPMPQIPVPLGGSDGPAQLELKPILDRVFDDGGYAESIYEDQPVPRLSPDDAAWAAQFLPASTS